MKITRELISFILALILFISCVALAQNYQFLITLIILAIGFGGVEGIYVLTTGKTISKRFWLWKDNAKTWQKILVASSIMGFAIYVIGHLFFQW